MATIRHTPEAYLCPLKLNAMRSPIDCGCGVKASHSLHERTMSFELTDGNYMRWTQNTSYVILKGGLWLVKICGSIHTTVEEQTRNPIGHEIYGTPTLLKPALANGRACGVSITVSCNIRLSCKEPGMDRYNFSLGCPGIYSMEVWRSRQSKKYLKTRATYNCL